MDAARGDFMFRRWCARALSALLLSGFAATAQAQTPSEAERAQALEIYRHVVSLDTSVEGGQTPAMAAYLAERFRAGGFAAEDVHVLTVGATAGLLVRYRGDGAGGRSILFMAHMDVVQARREEWQRDPFMLVEENGFFFGRGAIDNKAGLSLITATFLQLKAEGFTPTRDLIIWFSGDEETSGETTMALLRDHRALIGDAEFALNSDAGGGLLSPGGAPVSYFLQTAEKIYASFTLTAQNPGGHSSLPRADNAIFDLMDALGRVRAYEFPVMWNDTTIASFRLAATDATGPEAAAMRRFAERPGDRAAAAVLSRNPNLVGQVRTTCVPTLLSAGHAENALPQTATATVNCRIFPGVPVEDVQAQLQRLAGANVIVAPVARAFPSDASPLREDVVTALARAVHANYPGVQVVPAMSSGATDGLFFRNAGIPTYGVGEAFMRDEDEFSHGLDERNPVASFYNGLTHWRVLIRELAGRD
jgi:acetylornithine deacetylase/succinyl-diaminopimelate desuccinylase-like protein